MDEDMARHGFDHVMAAVAVYLHRHTQGGEVTVGAPALTLRLDPALTFEDVVARVRERFTAPRYGHEDLCRDLAPVLAQPRAAELPDHLARLTLLLDRLTAHPTAPIGRFDLLLPAEAALLEEQHATAHPVPACTLADLIEAQVARTPHVEAVRTAEATLDFEELNRRANRLARLLAARGAGPRRTVAIALPRSAQWVVAMVAVLKCGAAYVPLDLDHPVGRLAAVLADTEPVVVLTDHAGQDTVTHAHQGLTTLVLEDHGAELRHLADTDPTDGELPGGRARPGDAAYVIHTSGTTGRPKGVVVSHAAICNRLLWMRQAYGIEVGEAILHKTPCGFDVSVWELLLPLISGATLVAARPGGHQDPAYLATLIRREQVTTAHFVPAVLQACLEDPKRWQDTRLRRIICSGEALPTELAARAAQITGADVHNLYGPTEAAVDVTAWQYSPADTTPTVPIGRPVWNTRTHVLDTALRPVAPGVVGELYLAGDQLANGYLNQEAITAQRFVADPFGAPGERMYRTGDLVRRLPGGELEFVGRTDAQIKLRGVRIEPAGIEAALLAHPGVGAAVVLLREDRPGHPYLAAYVVPHPHTDPHTGPAPDADSDSDAGAGRGGGPQAWRAHLERLLPAAMVPGVFVTLERLPTTVNGKLDRSALPAPQSPAGPTPPHTPRQRTLCTLFAQVLDMPQIGPEDNFLTLGGHSLTAARLATLVRAELGVELSIRDLYANPTPAALAERLTHAPAALPPLLALPRPARIPLSATQASLWFLEQLDATTPTYNMPLVLRPHHALDTAALRAALADLTDRHEILRTRLTVQDATPYQDIAAPGTLHPELRVVDCPSTEIAHHVAAATHHRFDLRSDAPLWAALYGSTAGEQVLVIVLHHIAGDGWSLRPLAHDLSTAYAARLAGHAPTWPPLPVQYADYALWQRENLTELTRRQLDFWKRTLHDLPQQIPLPTGHPHTPHATDSAAGGPGGQHTMTLEADLHHALLRLAREHQASLFMVLHGALAALLTLAGAGTDIPIGTPVAARPMSALDELIGHFANTLVLRLDTGGNPRFEELLDRVKAVDLAAYDHQYLPFEQLVAELNPPRVAGRHPLFQVMLALQNNANAELRLGQETLPLEVGHTATAKFDLFVNAVERHDADGTPGGIEVRIDYRAELFEPAAVARLGRLWQALLDAIAADPTHRLTDLTDLTDPAGLSAAPRSQGPSTASNTAPPVLDQLLAHDGIRDGAHLAPAAGGQSVVVAVPTHAGALRGATQALAGHRVVAVTDLPRTPQGAVDEAALRRLPLIDEQLADTWQHHLAQLPGVLSAQVTLEVDTPEIAPLAFTTSTAHPTTATEPPPTAPPARAGRAPASLSAGPHLPEPDVHVLAEVLRRAAHSGPQAEVVHVLTDGTTVRDSYASLLTQAHHVLGGLRQRGLKPGDAVILQCDDNRDFLAALWGCVLGGFVAVPLTVPTSYHTPSAARAKLAGVHRMLHHPWVITSPDHQDALAHLLAPQDAGDPRPRLATVRELRTAEPDPHIHPARGEDTVLMLLTSGSTGLPKAVRLSHRNIVTRCAATAAVNALTPTETTLNWIPLDHVTGVVMFHLRDVYLTCRQIHAPTAWVLADPLRWLDLAHQHAVTVSWAPNFAFGLVAEHAHRMTDRTWDLSRLRLLTNAGEVVVPTTARRFLTLLAPHGLPQSAMHPGWGMSETSSVVTDAELPATPAPDEGAVVSCGRPYPGFAMRVVDENDHIVDEGTPGRLQVRGTTVTRGYHDNPEQNAEAFTTEGWFETGDLAYLRDGELYLTGRAKDVIIINGVNHYSHEIEAIAEELPFVERSFTAACAVRTDPAASTDELALFVHLTPGHDEATALAELRAKITRESGISPAHLIPVTADDIPKTEIGKIQRTLLRRRFEAGQYDQTIQRVQHLLGDATTVPDWFLHPVWQHAHLTPTTTRPTGPVLLLTPTPHTWADQLAEHLRAAGRLCTVVSFDDHPHRHDAATYRLRPDAVEDWSALLDQLAADDRTPQAVLHLTTPHLPDSPTTLHQAQQGGAEALLCLTKALAAHREDPAPIAIHLVTQGAFALQDGEQPSYPHATAGALLKSLRAELPWLTGRHIDLDTPDTQALLAEIHTPTTDPDIAYRAGQRRVRRLAPLPGPLPPAPAHLPGTPGGFHVISGGLGALAREIADHLLTHPHTHLLLLGRTPLPPEADWPAHIATGSDLGQRLAALRALREKGTVRYTATDVTDQHQVHAAITQAGQDWDRPLAAIFHLAGHFEQKPALEYDLDQWRHALAAKVTGGWILARLAAEQPGAAFIALSSVNGFFGGALSSAYAAANAFLDALATHHRHTTNTDAHSLAFSRFDALGMSRTHTLTALTEARGYRTVDLTGGLRSLRAALALPQAHLLIGADRAATWVGSHVLAPARPLHRLTARLALADDTDLTALTHAATHSAQQIGAGHHWTLRTAGTPHTDTTPANDQATLQHRHELEQRLTAIWSEVLGKHVEPGDNFFDLGGNSLLLLRAHTLLNERLGSDLTVVDLFAHPTIRSLATHLAPTQPPTPQPGATTPPPTTRRPQGRATPRRPRPPRRPDTEGTTHHV
ncbi:amino acid adenylation domain-containing protein [Kitasatospora sp. NPDC052896]|uniref:amino acid adenylation domain-containing protein n=1 Tax=Kitasatospora sp. NPDC052896 TaxID=3364061 RepID=UPI0037C97484